MEDRTPIQVQTVHGQVAQQIYNQVTLWKTPNPTEKLKHELPNNCHAEVDWLLAHADITAKQLLRAVKASALGSRDGRLVRQFTAVDYLMGGLGYGLFLYALTSVLAATMHVFRIASMYESYQRAHSPRKI